MQFQKITSLTPALLVLLFVLLAAPSHAQTNRDTGTVKGGISLTEIDDRATWSGFLTSSEQAVDREGIDDAEFERITRDANEIESKAREFISAQSSQADRLKKQLDELGPAPKDGEQAETPEIAAQRKALEDEFASTDGHLKDARLAIVRAQQLKSTIIQKRRDRFLRSITTRSENLLDVEFWGEFVRGFNGFGRSFQLMIKDSFSVLRARLADRPFDLALLLVLVVLGGFLYRFLRSQTHRLINISKYSSADAQPEKALRAATEFINTGILNSLAIYFSFRLIQGFDLFTVKLERFSWSMGIAGVTLILAYSLGRVFLSPTSGQNRIARISDEAASRVSAICRWSLIIVVVLFVLNDTALMLVSPFEVSIGLSAALTIVTVIALIRSLLIISRDRIGVTSANLQTLNVVSWVYLKPLLWLAAIVAAVALVFSYTAFAEYVSLQIVVGMILFGVLWLTLDLVDALKQALLSNEANPQLISQAIGIQPGRVKQFSVLGFGLVKTSVMVLVAMAMLLPWGFRTSEWVDWINEAFFGFQVGGLTISLSSIFMVVLIFLIGYGVTRAVQGWLSNQFLPTTSIDIGLRNSISTILGYVGIVVALMLAVSAAGADLSNLAIVAGALSVGVGFGLQSIVNNFVSGLILLAERPIKSGDWIVTSGGEGTVRKISVRSTEIETFERATIIVPNSTLITESVTNWTHSSKLGRVNIVIGVGYNSDPDQVRELLLKCFNDHDGILKNPAPSAFLTDFGADALTFDVRGFLSNIENGFGVKSDLRYAILKAFREANIEIPFPQRDVHLKADWGQVGQALADTPEAKPAPVRRAARASKK